MHEQGIATSTRHSDIGRTPFKEIGCKRGAFGISGVPATATSDQVRISRVGILPSTNDDERDSPHLLGISINAACSRREGPFAGTGNREEENENAEEETDSTVPHWCTTGAASLIATMIRGNSLDRFGN
jgi:hypothetical protein